MTPQECQQLQRARQAWQAERDRVNFLRGLRSGFADGFADGFFAGLGLAVAVAVVTWVIWVAIP